MIFLKDLVCSTSGGLYLMSLMRDDVRIIIPELLFKLRLPSFQPSLPLQENRFFFQR